jgi:tRNA threonylcarbamoyladenosine biosynthesis protein TsaB
MLALALDASTAAGSIALIRDGAVVREQVVAMRGEREERLMPAVVDILRETDVDVAQLTTIACGDGPGSFTSLRIAAAICKGIAAVRLLPLHVAPSPLLVVTGAEPRLAPGKYVTALDAMRGDVFTLVVAVGHDGTASSDGHVTLVPRATAEDTARSLGAELVGPAEDPPRAPHARGFAELLRTEHTRRVDVAAWEPAYGRKAEAQVRWEIAHGRPLEAR